MSLLLDAVREAALFAIVWTVLACCGSQRAKNACREHRLPTFVSLYVAVRILLTTFDPSMGRGLVGAILHAMPLTDVLRM